MKKHLQKDKCFITCLMSHNQRLVALIFKMGLVILATFHLDFPGQTWVVTCCGGPRRGKNMFDFKTMLQLGHPSGGLLIMTSALLTCRLLLTKCFMVFSEVRLILL